MGFCLSEAKGIRRHTGFAALIPFAGEGPALLPAATMARQAGEPSRRIRLLAPFQPVRERVGREFQVDHAATRWAEGL